MKEAITPTNKEKAGFAKPANEINTSLTSVDNQITNAYTVSEARTLLRNALMLLDNCTDPSQPVPTPASEKGATEMAQIHRQRVRIGEKEDGTPMIKWVQGKTQDELNDNIVRAYIKHGLLQKLLSEDPGIISFQTNDSAQKPASRFTFKEYADTWFKTYKEGV